MDFQTSNSLIAFLAPFLPHLLGLEGEPSELGSSAFALAREFWGQLEPLLGADAQAMEYVQQLANNPGNAEAQLALANRLPVLLADKPIPIKEIPFRERMSVARALMRLGREAEAAAIQRSLASDPEVNPQLRIGAAEALGDLGQVEEAARLLLDFARDAAMDIWVRRRAAEALGRFCRANELLEIARDPYMAPWVRECATRPLQGLGFAAETAEIWAGLARDNNADVNIRRRALRALRELGHAEELLALARDPSVDEVVREESLQQVAELGRADELLALATDLNAVDWIRVLAADALSDLGRMDLLLQLARTATASPVVRVQAIKLLGRHTTHEALTALHALANDEQMPAWIRMEATKALKARATQAKASLP